MRFGRSRPAGDDETDLDDIEPLRSEQVADEEPVDPGRLRGTEPLYGFVVALELIGVAVLNLVDTTGKGAPKHPQTTLEVVALIVAISFFALLWTRSRTAAALGAIGAAFFVTLPKVPDKLTLYHVISLSIGAAYGLIIATRRRREEKAQLGGRPRPTPRSRPGDRRRPAPAGRSGAPTGPRPNRRYTPPKQKRKSPGRS